jgi:hypothetical protein
MDEESKRMRRNFFSKNNIIYAYLSQADIDIEEIFRREDDRLANMQKEKK